MKHSTGNPVILQVKKEEKKSSSRSKQSMMYQMMSTSMMIMSRAMLRSYQLIEGWDGGFKGNHFIDGISRSQKLLL